MAAKKKTTTTKKKETKKAVKVSKPVEKESSVEWWKRYQLTRGQLFKRIILFFVLVYVVFHFKGLLIAASVNGEPISRLSIVQDLERDSGKAILDSKINEALIRQKARKSFVTVTDEDINAEIENIEKNVLGESQNIDDVLALQGMTREDLVKQLEVQVMVGKLLEGDVNVTDADVEAYVEQNKQTLAEGFTEDDLRNFAREQLKQQKLQQRFSTWIQEIRDEANIRYFVQY